MAKLLDSNRIDAATLKLSRLEQTPATVAFLGGELDAIVFASAPESLMVQMLLQTPGVKLMNFAQSEAYSRRFRLPDAHTPAARRGGPGRQHPARRRAAGGIHHLADHAHRHPPRPAAIASPGRQRHPRRRRLVQERPRIPQPRQQRAADLAEAERAIKNGTPVLQRYLPFWVANLVERMWLVMGIIIAIMLPLSRIIPPLYAFRVRSRIFRWYGRLRDIENRVDGSGDGDRNSSKNQGLLEELNDLERRAEKDHGAAVLHR